MTFIHAEKNRLIDGGMSCYVRDVKIRETNIQYTEVVQGMRTEHHFCTQCAKELDFGHYSAIFDGEFPLGKLLSSLLGTRGLVPNRKSTVR